MPSPRPPMAQPKAPDMNDRTAFEVIPATALDLARILEWLRDDDLLPDGGSGRVRGLYCDADRVAEAWRDGRLFVIRDPNITTPWATPALAHIDKGAGERVAFCIPVDDTKLIHVHPAYRGRGYGTVLMRFMLDYARAAGIDRLSVETSPGNQKFWQRHGFKPVEHAPPMYALTLKARGGAERMT